MVGSLDHKVCVFEDKSVCGPWGGAGDWRVAQVQQDHRHYVQGVAYDPGGVYIASLGSDRALLVAERKRGGKGKGRQRKVNVLAESTKGNKEEGGEQPPRQQQQQQGGPRPHLDDKVNNSNSNDAENDAGKARAVTSQQQQQLPPLPPAPTAPDAAAGQQQPAAPEAKFELLKAKQVKFRSFPGSDDASPPLLPPAAAGPEDQPPSDVFPAVLPAPSKPGAAARHNLYVDETMQSFFRRLTWTPDGSYLLTPAGIFQEDKDAKQQYVCYAYGRHEFEG